MKTYATLILGCKVNNFEAHALKEQMNKDYQEVDFKDIADIYVIYTCCVTNVAESKTRKFIHGARRRNPNAYIVVVGCYAQTKPNHPVFDDVDLVIGSKYKDRIKEFIDAGVKGKKVEDLNGTPFEELYVHEFLDQTRATLKIEDGCNQFCSYCVIPYARGRERSAKLENVVKEAKELVKSAKEIVLTGIHTGRYYDGEHHLIDLLRELVKIDGLETIRLSSIEMNEVTDEIIQLIADNPKMGTNLHIPLQAGSNKILKLMNRPYTIEKYKERIAYIRSLIPNVSISTDLIVGFPNETDEDFKETLKTLKEINFSFIHVFPYARKALTRADKMEGHMDESIKKDRVRQVIALEKPISKAYNESFIGKEILVLIERTKNGVSLGHSKEYLDVEVKGELNHNEFYRVLVKSADENGVKGEAICC